LHNSSCRRNQWSFFPVGEGLPEVPVLVAYRKRLVTFFSCVANCDRISGFSHQKSSKILCHNGQKWHDGDDHGNAGTFSLEKLILFEKIQRSFHVDCRRNPLCCAAACSILLHVITKENISISTHTGLFVRCSQRRNHLVSAEEKRGSTLISAGLLWTTLNGRS